MRNVPDDLEPLGEWELFQSFPDETAAGALSGKLRASDCPTKISPRQLSTALETEYCVFVPRSLMHRARWIVAQLPISDAELDALAVPTQSGTRKDR